MHLAPTQDVSGLSEIVYTLPFDQSRKDLFRPEAQQMYDNLSNFYRTERIYALFTRTQWCLKGRENTCYQLPIFVSIRASLLNWRFPRMRTSSFELWRTLQDI